VQNDVVLFISFSGKTAELHLVAKHLPASVTVMAITAHADASSCPLLEKRQPQDLCATISDLAKPSAILLPAPIHDSEEATFGVAAPTTSTTVALAIGDMLALTVANQLHQQRAGAIFKKNHPGGTIGAEARKC
jgi:D-arabinose 5-phosphate isomerase GutQ